MNVDELFCGYKHWTLESTPRCFYVGKGRYCRPASKHSRNHKWFAVIAQYGLRVEICIDSLTDEQSRHWEIENISLENTFSTSHDHNDINDIGCNFTRGGDGSLGRKWSESQRSKFEAISSTQEYRAKMSYAQLAPDVQAKKRQSMTNACASEATKAKRKRTNETAETKNRRSAASKLSQNRFDVKLKKQITYASEQFKSSRARTEALPETKARRSLAAKLAHTNPEMKAKRLKPRKCRTCRKTGHRANRCHLFALDPFKPYIGDFSVIVSSS